MVVVSREMVDGWAKYKIVVESVFKRGTENMQRGETSLWISPQGVICKCPKLRVGRRYLLLGEFITHPIQFPIVFCLMWCPFCFVRENTPRREEE